MRKLTIIFALLIALTAVGETSSKRPKRGKRYQKTHRMARLKKIRKAKVVKKIVPIDPRDWMIPIMTLSCSVKIPAIMCMVSTFRTIKEMCSGRQWERTRRWRMYI